MGRGFRIGARRAAIVASLWVVLGCATPDGAPPAIEVEPLEAATPWTHLEVADGPDDFKFVVVSDRTGEERPGVFDAAVDKINLLQPAFVVSVGDLIEGYTDDTGQLASEWEEFDGFVERLDAPFFYAAGNHDYSNTAMAEDWQRRFGPSYYAFSYKDVLFLVLNSEILSSVAKPGTPIAGPDTADAQLAYVERVLAEHPDPRWTIVIVHQPLWDPPGAKQEPLPAWQAIEEQLAGRPHTVFAGHYHRYVRQVRHDHSYITLATTGGGSEMRGIDRGEFDHVVLVTMSDDGPVVANLMLDGIHGESVRTLATRDLVRRLDHVVSAQPSWVPGSRFREGEQRFELHNPTSVPIVVRAELREGPDLRVSPATLEHELAPGATDEVTFTLRTDGSRGLETLAPAFASWTVEAPGEHAPVRVENTGWVFPDRRFPVTRTRPLRIDGDLEDWGALRFDLTGWPRREGGVAEADLRFDVRTGPDRLYLAFAVNDPTPTQDPNRIAREQDGLVVELDARPAEERNRNLSFRQALGQGDFRKIFMAWLNPIEPAPDPIFDAFMAPLPEGYERVVVPTDAGYRAEIAIPHAALDAQAGEPWQAFRLNVVVQDFDGDDPHPKLHGWRPSRYGLVGLAVEGAGTFERP
ncbi:MAG: metallophosphoesterase [Myxococcota bacterium]